MEISKCKECGNKYGYFDSPTMYICSCGGELEDGYEFKVEDIGNVDYPTVSC